MSAKPDKKPDGKETPKEGGAAPAKKKPPLMLIGAVAGIMVVEGAAVYFVASATGPKSAAAEIQTGHGEEEDHDATIEVPLLEDKFQNMQSGRPFIWDTSIVLKVREKDQEVVVQTLEKKAAEVKEGVSLIFRRAPHTQLVEPGLETLNRQLHAYLNKLVEKDAEGKPRIQRVLIPKCKGFAAD
ncbi:MAG TPA: hypothetical protein VD971_07825 [Phycisphaerales bacterium]|nr:hypothetical protein [Phycisphaerales bacterium]